LRFFVNKRRKKRRFRKMIGENKVNLNSLLKVPCILLLHLSTRKGVKPKRNIMSSKSGISVDWLLCFGGELPISKPIAANITSQSGKGPLVCWQLLDIRGVLP